MGKDWQRSGESALDRRRAIALEMPRWFPLYSFLAFLSLLALMLSLGFLVAWLAYVAGSIASAQQDMRRDLNSIEVKVNRLYTNDRIRRDRMERDHVEREPDPPPD